MSAVLKFLAAARSLANQGLSKEAIEQFAKNEFGEISELLQRQINNIYKPGKGITSIKKDPDFDDTVIQMQIDEFGPYNPKDPLKNLKKQKDKKRLKDADDPNYDAEPADFDPDADNETFATGGRAGFKDGMSRRKFMKIMGGLAAIPFVGKFFKAGKVAAPAVEAAKETVTSGGTPPPYFFNLVKKIKNLGDDVTEKQAIKEREIVTEYKDYKLTEDLDTGELTIQKTSIEGDFDTPVPTAEEVYMQYKPGKGQVDEATGKVADEYVEDTSYVGTSRGNRGEIVNTIDGVPDEVIQEGTVFEDNVADFITKEAPSIKKASGGIARMLGE